MKKQLLKIAVLAISAVLFVTTGCDQQSHEHTYSTDWSSDDDFHWHQATCKHTEEVSEKGKHKWDSGEVTTEATCTSEGEKKYTCKVCGKTKTQTVDKLSHSWDDGEEITAATCTSDGMKKYTCKVCSAEKEETVPKAHKWNSGEIITAETCETTGAKKLTCRVCAETKTKVIPAKGHDYGEEVITPSNTVEKGQKKVWCNRTGCSLATSARYEDIPELYSTPVDCTTGQAATPASQYVYFGVFPKTIRANSITVDETESNSKTMGANKYYKGTDQEWYVKCRENAYGTGDVYKYSNGVQAKQVSKNSYEWFKVEPIKWKVLTTNYNGTGKALLLAEDILTANVSYYISNSNRTINSKTVYPNNYKYSKIRAYLNGKFEEDDLQSKTEYTDKGFLQTAFSETAQSLISVTDVDNSAESTGYTERNLLTVKTYTCDNTSDKVFLLSNKDVKKAHYGFENGNSRIRFPTDYAKANYAYQSNTSGYGLLILIIITRSVCTNLALNM